MHDVAFECLHQNARLTDHLVLFQLLHEYWMSLRDHVSAIDELGMATERMRVRLPDEPKPKVLHIIEPHEVMMTKRIQSVMLNVV